jgi:mRNA-degrading endonuclease toxin of MazEF toxin-antitoxin module
MSRNAILLFIFRPPPISRTAPLLAFIARNREFSVATTKFAVVITGKRQQLVLESYANAMQITELHLNPFNSRNIDCSKK